MKALEGVPVTAIVLAGGYGRRMGGEKLFLEVNSTPLVLKVLRKVSRFSGEILLSVAPRQTPYVSGMLSGIISQYGLRLVEDRHEGDGPLAGILEGLKQASLGWSFVCGCDMPWISEPVVRTLWRRGEEDADVIVPRIGGYFEPLHAFYGRGCIPAIERAVRSGERKITSFYDLVKVSAVDDEHFSHLPGYKKSFGNLNSRNDLLDPGNAHLFD
ncbi:Molybdenum cofactor guanylyltransferase [bioreactor metagenome]|jgi:molybdopterin-guanine dinucleotide biosynthesis protein A|uniref:Molybdenum cofactor guanylyltransferase n=1 Tax=bioreactor metagenome TaxID=1076179 RepID=A0A644Y4R8_9ZZZZ|nr:molybdenum cofactor guanylyltransferase [Aminivibrio sp.]MDD3514277.1 molybdenum cofactor guanylyltransferase [Synergistaceae bacterium]NCB15834.1 molybdenum cofactor guanylyltransferase [Synergistales bacterium]MEA4952948.1 molybdenum cofactor guanylyltransferase [Aminivibrio sp.]HPF85171.1 molybdenum cofactor guanylyltransferase [Aminivibrio sp.]HPK06345.1 molybdenum cofactor guanylyltransferase [Aminivibrio sp.]